MKDIHVKAVTSYFDDGKFGKKILRFGKMTKIMELETDYIPMPGSLEKMELVVMQ